MPWLCCMAAPLPTSGFWQGEFRMAAENPYQAKRTPLAKICSLRFGLSRSIVVDCYFEMRESFSAKRVGAAESWVKGKEPIGAIVTQSPVLRVCSQCWDVSLAVLLCQAWSELLVGCQCATYGVTLSGHGCCNIATPRPRGLVAVLCVLRFRYSTHYALLHVGQLCCLNVRAFARE